MSMPKISDITPDIKISRTDAVNVIIASIAMEELALAHILNAEGEKLQYVLGTLDRTDPGDVTLCDIMAVNNSIHKTLRGVINAEMMLHFKLEDALKLDEGSNECRLKISGQKIWRDGNNKYKTRPATVEINLYRDDVVFRRDIIDSMGDGKYSFECLPIFNAAGGKHIYRVDEKETPKDYTKTIDGYNIINTALPGTTTISGKKIWNDNGNALKKRPTSINVNLYADGTLFDTELVTSPADNVSEVEFSFLDVPLFDDEGNAFVYTVDEDDLAEYKKSITDFTITNTIITT